MVPLARLLLLLITCSFLFSCNQKTDVSRAVYYWKNNDRRLYSDEVEFLANAQIEKCYVKFFEVAEDGAWVAAPIAKSRLEFGYNFKIHDTIQQNKIDTCIKNMEIIPTIYVENSVVLHLKKNELDTLAGNILYLVEKYWREHYVRVKNHYTAIQIDCDWTPKSKENYFYLLQQIKNRNKNLSLSCTLRLYPYAYPDSMGVPPVDRAMLMCYNLTTPLQNENKNSILDLKELEAYLNLAQPYPLPLDIALPVFSYQFLYQNNQYADLLNTPVENLTAYVKLKSPMWYEVTNDLILDDKFLRGGDEIKIESISDTLINQAIDLLVKYLPYEHNITVSLFHLDDNTINNYELENINGFYNSFQ